MRTLSLLLACLALAISAHANIYLHEPLERIPKADEIIAFSNGVRPASGTQIKLTKADIQAFLTDGTVVRDPSSWKHSETWTNVGQKYGVFFDKQGLAYFWRIEMEGVLFLQTESGQSAQIILEKPAAEAPVTTDRQALP